MYGCHHPRRPKLAWNMTSFSKSKMSYIFDLGISNLENYVLSLTNLSKNPPKSLFHLFLRLRDLRMSPLGPKPGLSQFPLLQGKPWTLSFRQFYLSGVKLMMHYALIQHDADYNFTCSDALTHSSTESAGRGILDSDNSTYWAFAIRESSTPQVYLIYIQRKIN